VEFFPACQTSSIVAHFSRGCRWAHINDLTREFQIFPERILSMVENSPAFQGWGWHYRIIEVPTGTKERFCRPYQDLINLRRRTQR
ncbi:MAG TPA: hypothetical protein VNX27_06315, partial [Chthoniobacterales bacterium]|nr:hypothetical protein [Chthoniobacterales bacterium]